MKMSQSNGISTDLVVRRVANEEGLRVRRGLVTKTHASYELFLPYEDWVHEPVTFCFERHDPAYIEKTLRTIAASLRSKVTA